MNIAASPIAHADTIEGWMTPDELGFLHELAQRVGSIAELGCWKGRSTYVLADGCRGPVYAVDHWRGSWDEQDTAHKEAAMGGNILSQFNRNVGEFDNVHVVMMDHNAAAEFVPDVDMVFIDGAHDYDSVLANIKAWLPKAKRIIAGHDLFTQDVARAVRDTLNGRVCLGAGSIWFVEVG